MSWGCPHQLNDYTCTRLKRECHPGIKGCVLHGRFVFAGDTEEVKVMAKVDSIRRGLASGGTQSLDALLADAKKLGLKIYACPNAMANLNISQKELIGEIDGIMGLSAFLGYARGASVNWYI